MAKKRTNGEGTIRQRESGLWECTLMDGFQPNGKRKYVSFYGDTQAEVKKKMKTYFKAKEEGSLAAQDYTFGERAEIWFDNHKENIQSTTQESYRYTLRILEGHFGRRRLKQIKAMRSNEIKNKTIAMRNGELPLLRDGEYWTDDERRRVQIMFEDGRPVNEIALELQRTERTVYQQISSMNLYVTAPEKMRRHKSGPKEPVCFMSAL